jgi:drug/metabolite transporter (DMT)-like permease
MLPWALDRTPPLKAYLALISVCFFWGTTYLAIRMALESFPPLVLVATRFLLSSSVLFAVFYWKSTPIPKGRPFWLTVLCGVLILGVGNGGLTFAEREIPSGLTGLIITIGPFWMVTLEALLPGGEKLHGPTILGMLLGLTGAVLLFGPDARSLEGGSFVKGFLLLQLSMASWSFGSIAQKRLKIRENPIVAGAIHQLAAGCLFLPLALTLPQHPIAWSARGAGALIYLVIFGSIVGYTSYAYALAKLPVAVVSLHTYVNSVVAVLLGWLVYREAFGLREALAMAIIFAGVAVVKRTARG